MPSTRRRRRRHPLPTDWGAIGLAERTRWSLGIISLEFWGSWEEWAACYGVCRPAFLAWYNERPKDHEPYSELLFAAYQKGTDVAAVTIPQPPDPRRILAGKRVGGW